MCGEFWLLRLLLFHLLDTLQAQPSFALNEVQCLCPLWLRCAGGDGVRNLECHDGEETCLIWILSLSQLTDLDC